MTSTPDSGCVRWSKISLTLAGPGLPAARLVVDHFHVIRLANATLDEVRRRTQNDSLGHRGRKDDPLYRIRRRLLASHDRLHPASFARVLAWLDAGDPQGEVGAYLAKELLRETYLATNALKARRRLVAFYEYCNRSDVAELNSMHGNGLLDPTLFFDARDDSWPFNTWIDNDCDRDSPAGMICVD